MNKNRFLFVLICIAVSLTPPGAIEAIEAIEAIAQNEKSLEQDVEVMILGSIHLTGGGQDVINNPNIKNYLAPEGQQEIRQVLDRLEAFAPDKIMLELEFGSEDAFNQSYRSYLDGKHELAVNERQQIGMRLAKRLGHKKLYAIDFDSFLDNRPAFAAAKELQQDRLLEEYENSVDVLRADVATYENKSLVEQLVVLNSGENRLQRTIWLTVAQMGTLKDLQGVEGVITWWQRNLAIFARAANQAEPGERVLIIFGAGHRTILEEFFDDAIGFTLVSPLPYLEK